MSDLCLLKDYNEQLSNFILFSFNLKKTRYLIILTISLSFIAGCITQFIPETDEATSYLVVEGLITDQCQASRIKISKSIPLGTYLTAEPLRECRVTITDENGVVYVLEESPGGIYCTDSTKFRGHIGGIYILKIIADRHTYISSPMEMLPVPPIDSVFYEKKVIIASNEWGHVEEGCQVYLNTYDPSHKCIYYRWDFTETWEFMLPYPVQNHRCWITENSNKISIKNTSAYDQARVTSFPLYFISNATDRLNIKYSMLINQYSLSENEYNFWEKLQNVSENVGGLYDMTPMAIPSNISCVNFPDEIILGYFSVSAVSQKRLFIKDRFMGQPYLYRKCLGDTIKGDAPIPGLNIWAWVIEDYTTFKIITYYKECADCTTRGTIVKPSFWGQ